MAIFTDLDWRRLDLFALVFGRGIASVDSASAGAAREWLAANGYVVIPLDFANGISPVVEELGQRLHWLKNFGYELPGESRNLAALHDGFDFEVAESGGLVLRLLNFGCAIKVDAQWSSGFLSIVSEHSLRHLACGRRFFGVLEVESGEASEVGLVFEQLSVPYPFPFHVGAAA